jgi:hypothetical protein
MMPGAGIPLRVDCPINMQAEEDQVQPIQDAPIPLDWDDPRLVVTEQQAVETEQKPHALGTRSHRSADLTREERQQR